jgi:mRNA-degrading endonuclease YafQ of YafQ-DinJ toxin-antitoxin module
MKTIRIAASFSRRAKKLIKRNPNLDQDLRNSIAKLLINPFDPTLYTHPLSGKLNGKYACSLTAADFRFAVRLVFAKRPRVPGQIDLEGGAFTLFAVPLKPPSAPAWSPPRAPARPISNTTSKNPT